MSDVAFDDVIEVRFPEGSPSKFERDKRAFYRLLPNLLETHAGQYVAIHEERVVDAGVDQLEVALRVQRRIGAVPVYVHLVSDDVRSACRSGVIRVHPRQGSGS